MTVITWGPNSAGAVRSRSARCLPRLRPNSVVAERSMSSPPKARTLRVPRGHGALDVFTAWGPEFCGCREVAERPTSSPPGARTLRVPRGHGALDVLTAWGPNFAGAVRSRSARRLHRLGPELCGCREVCVTFSDVFTAWGRSLRVP